MGAEMTWFARQMMSYETDDLDITYKYDSDGLRTQKVVNGVKHEYYYVDGLLVYENIGDENLMYYRYDQNGTVIAINRIRLSDGATGLLYPVTNSRGDVVELRNGSGVLNAKYTYDSWGKLISITDANGNPVSEDSLAMFNSIRYRGYVYDRETGLYYLQSRYYDPETGRFLNADSVDFIGYSGEVLSYNVFAYCENNAVMYSDFLGNSIKDFVFDCWYFGIIDSLHYFWFIVYKRIKSKNTLDDGYFAQLALTKSNVKVWICYRDSVDKNKNFLKDNIKKNKQDIKNFVTNGVCKVLANFLFSCYKEIYKTNTYKYRTVKGVEVEIILHLYMYYFDIDKYKYYAQSSCIDIDNNKDGNGRKIEFLAIPTELWIGLCKKAIKNGKENKLVTSIIKKFI